MSRKPKRYHYIYKTTCKVTGKFYVGMHSSDSLDDGYLGSGKILGYSRKKYGDENHVREILEFCSSRDELKQREKEIVNEALLADPLNINLKYGGEGGFEYVNSILTFEQRSIIGTLGNTAPIRNKIKAAFNSAQTRARRGNARGGFNNKTIRSEMTKRATSKDSIEKRKNTYSRLGHAQGTRNSQYGVKRVGVCKDGKIRKILPTQLQEFLDSGWRKGFK